MNISRRQLLPYVLAGMTASEIAPRMGKKEGIIQAQRLRVIQELRLWFILEMLTDYGTPEQVKGHLIRLFLETKLQRFLRHIEIENLIEAAGGDLAFVGELFQRYYPGQIFPEEMNRLLKSQPYKDISDRVRHQPKTPKTAARMSRMIDRLVGNTEKENTLPAQILVMKRDFRDFYYPYMRRDFEENLTEGRDFLEAQIRAETTLHPAGSLKLFLYRSTLDYYANSMAATLRGFKEFHGAKLTLAQKCGTVQALQTLMNPNETCAIITSEARSRKTMMAFLAAFNIKNSDGEYAVQHVLFTTKKRALFEVAEEIRMRLNSEIAPTVIVLDGTSSAKKLAALEMASNLTGNVIVVANYNAVAQFSEIIDRDFKPGCHIIDEAEYLKSGNKIDLAPPILKIKAAYRIAISARPVSNREDDINAILSWARRHTYPSAESLKGKSITELYEDLEPVSVRWRLAVIHPELGMPQTIDMEVPYNDLEEEQIRKIRENDGHLFSRHHQESRAGMAIPDTEAIELSSKIKVLDDIIDTEQKNKGKVLVLLSRIEDINKLVDRYNKKYGIHFAAAVLSSNAKADTIRQFRSESYPMVILSTEQQLGSSLNLCHIEGSAFHNSTVVRVTGNMGKDSDVGKRFIDPNQMDPIREITLVNVFQKRPIEDLASAVKELNSIADNGGKKPGDNRKRVEGWLRFVQMDEASIQIIANYFLDGNKIKSMGELKDMVTTQNLEKIVEALRPKTMDQAWLRIRDRNKAIREGVVDGSTAKAMSESISAMSVMQSAAAPLAFEGALRGSDATEDMEETDESKEEPELPAEAETHEELEASAATIIFASDLRATRADNEEEDDGPESATKAVHAPRNTARAAAIDRARIRELASGDKVERLEKQRQIKTALEALLADAESLRFVSFSDLDYLAKMRVKDSSNPVFLDLERLVNDIKARHDAWQASENQLSSLPWEARIAVSILSRNPPKVLKLAFDDYVTETAWNDFVQNAMDINTAKITDAEKINLRGIVHLGWRPENFQIINRALDEETFIDKGISDIEHFYALRPRLVAAPIAEESAASTQETAASASAESEKQISPEDLKAEQTAVHYLNEVAQGIIHHAELIDILKSIGIGQVVITKIVTYLLQGNELSELSDLVEAGIHVTETFKKNVSAAITNKGSGSPLRISA